MLQYKTEKDGVVETRVERRVIVSSGEGDIDHDAVSRAVNYDYLARVCCMYEF